MEYKEIFALIEDFKKLVDDQISARNQSGKGVDPRLQGINRQLNAIVINPVYRELAEERQHSTIGQVVSVKVKEEKNSILEIKPKPGKIGEVVSPGNVPAADAGGVKQEATNKEDEEFLKTIKEKTPEQLSGSAFSKPALLQIVKKINEFEGKEVIEVTEEDTKVTLGEKIFNQLNPATDEQPADEGVNGTTTEEPAADAGGVETAN